MTPGTPVRLRDPATSPDIGTRRGIVVLEPVETPGVVTVEWDGRDRVSWHKAGDLEVCGC